MSENKYGDNNPRVFAETIALDVWRTPFDEGRATADLHIDVVFGQGRVGGGDDPVRFRLSLRQAEIHVSRDTARQIDIVRSSVRREKPMIANASRTAESKKCASASGEVGFDASSLSAQGNAKGGASVAVTERFEQQMDLAPMRVQHRPTEHGYAFSVTPNRVPPNSEGHLDGAAWSADDPIMRIKDTNSQRKKGDPPEVLIEIQCRREDLVIEDIEFKDRQFPSWRCLSRNKQVAVEQYIREELVKFGMECGDLSDGFTRIVLADAVSREE